MISHLIPALRATLVLAAFTGILFPLAMTGVAQLLFPYQANGSLIVSGSTILGSELLAQSFSRPEYFHPRPSAAGSGYAGEASSGTNYGPTSKKLIFGEGDFPGVKQLAETYRATNKMPGDGLVPVDAVTRSASGLDPHITPLNADLQAARVAEARKLPVEEVKALVGRMTEGRDLGFLGEPRVNVLRLNLELDRLGK